MAAPQIRFDNGEHYERVMGIWSQTAGNIFLDWLAPPKGLRWIDIGCGNGAFTELLVQRCIPSQTQGIDPSEGQLTFARTRPGAKGVTFTQGDAMALPSADNQFDAATMALAIFFVPEPAKGVAEMVRVVQPGGTIAAYAWDMPGGGFPWDPIQSELRAIGVTPPLPPSADASRLDTMRDLWTQAGLVRVETREITVERSFPDFDDLWATVSLAGSLLPALSTMTPPELDQFKARVRARISAPATGPVVLHARANAVKGYLPA